MHGVANFVARLLFLVGSHRGVLEALGYDNQLLRDKLQEFCRLRESTSIPTCCFFEAYDTDYGRRFGLPGLFRGMVSINDEPGCANSDNDAGCAGRVCVRPWLGTLAAPDRSSEAEQILWSTRPVLFGRLETNIYYVYYSKEHGGGHYSL